MSAIMSSETAMTPKKKGNKKKKSKSKLNGDTHKPSIDERIGEEVDGEEEQDEVQDDVAMTSAQIDGTEEKTNGHIISKEPQPTTDAAADTTSSANPPQQGTQNNVMSSSDADGDTSARLDELTQSREALRQQVEELRKSLEFIQQQHDSELSSVRAELSEKEEENKRLEQEKIDMEVQFAAERDARMLKVKETIAGVKTRLNQCNVFEAECETKGDRIVELEAELEDERNNKEAEIRDMKEEDRKKTGTIRQMEDVLRKLNEETADHDRELAGLRRTQNDLFAQNRELRDAQEELLQQNRYLKEEADVAREEMDEWKEQADYHRSKCEELMEKVALLDPLELHCREQEKALKQAEEDMKRIAEEWQEKLDALHVQLTERDRRVQDAEADKDVLATKLASFEEEKAADIKKKDEEIAEFRQKYIIEREAVKKVQRENRRLAKINPQDYIEKQVVTSHVIKFLTLDRADPTRFQILQALSGMLAWTEAENEKAGLARPGAATSSASALRVPSLGNIYRTPSSSNLGAEFGVPDTPGVGPGRGSLWGFMGRAEKGSRAGSVAGTTEAGWREDDSVAPTSRSASVSSVAPK